MTSKDKAKSFIQKYLENLKKVYMAIYKRTKKIEDEASRQTVDQNLKAICTSPISYEVYPTQARKEIRPYAAYTDNGKGLFTLKEYNSMWSDHAGVQTLITPKGRETFRLLCKELMKGADE